MNNIIKIFSVFLLFLFLFSCSRNGGKDNIETIEKYKPIHRDDSALVYPIGFWDYREAAEINLEHPRFYAECGVTVTHSRYFKYGRDDKLLMYDFLDRCYENSVKVILEIEGLTYHFVKNEEEYRALWNRAISDFASHPAFYTFSLGDEPRNDSDFDLLKKACKVIKEIAPNIKPFINFLPYWSGMENGVFGNGKTIEGSMPSIVMDCGFSYFSFDCYSQMSGGVDGFFTSLRKYFSVSKQSDTDMWVTMISLGEHYYEMPDENAIRWQINVAAASGAKGILWYYWQDANNYSNVHGAPINAFGEKSDRFELFAESINEFQNNYGSVLMSLTNIGVYHTSRNYGGYPSYDGSEKAVIKLSSDNYTPGIISFFSGSDGSYVVIVNNSMKESDVFSLDFNTSEIGQVYIIRGNGEKNEELNLMNGSASFDLRPGQMEIIKYK